MNMQNRPLSKITIAFVGTPPFMNYIIGCHGNYAFYIAHIRFFRILVVPMNSMASMKNCPGMKDRSN